MAVIKGLQWTFDTKASLYEKMRPGYVDTLYDALFEYIPVTDKSNVAEIGSGAGQATLPVLKTGCRLTAIECGKNFSEILKDKFGEYENFSVITAKFEDTDFEENSFDLVFAASSFHWIPQKTGYEKVYSMLRPGGAFARFSNHPYTAKDNPYLSEEIEKLYDRYYYTFHNKMRETISEFTFSQAEETAQIAEKYGFCDIRCELFYRERVFSAEEYVALLGTYSDHIAIEESIRTEFFSEIREAINSHGGSITIHDTIDLQLARK